jgi:hypothetical protein
VGRAGFGAAIAAAIYFGGDAEIVGGPTVAEILLKGDSSSFCDSLQNTVTTEGVGRSTWNRMTVVCSTWNTRCAVLPRYGCPCARYFPISTCPRNSCDRFVPHRSASVGVTDIQTLGYATEAMAKSPGPVLVEPRENLVARLRSDKARKEKGIVVDVSRGTRKIHRKSGVKKRFT